MDQHHHHQAAPARAAVRGGGGEIVEVQGGHIVRSTGRKDRHSKVCTAKGPRDRRVRLSAHTAIKFYDVQDRLGYDRPSKAVDWLIKNAKPAIDELDELPPWRPTADPPSSTSPAPASPVSSAPAPPPHQPPGFSFHHLNISGSGSGPGASGFFPPSLDSDVIADTIKSFFPISSSSSSSSSCSSSSTTTSSLMHYQNYTPDLLSRTSSQSQDLRLSLQSFQNNPILHHHQTLQPCEHALFAGASHISFDDAAAWSEQQQHEMERFQRSIAWNSPDATAGAGYVFGAAPQPMLGPSPIFSQRGPLQSSTSPAVRAWTDSPAMAAGEHQAPPEVHHHPPSSSSAVANIGFAAEGFSGFHIPARIQGEDEHDANRPPSASSARRH